MVSVQPWTLRSDSETGSKEGNCCDHLGNQTRIDEAVEKNAELSSSMVLFLAALRSFYWMQQFWYIRLNVWNCSIIRQTKKQPSIIYRSHNCSSAQRVAFFHRQIKQSICCLLFPFRGASLAQSWSPIFIWLFSFSFFFLYCLEEDCLWSAAVDLNKLQYLRCSGITSELKETHNSWFLLSFVFFHMLCAEII